MPLPSLRVTFMTAKWPICVVALVFVASQASAQEPTPADASNPSTQQVENTVPVPAHTGWETFVKDTGRDFLAFPKRKSTWAILAIIASG